MDFFSTKIAAIVVTYEPDFDLLEELIRVVNSQVSKIYIVDNGSNLANDFTISSDVAMILLSENMGIAHAQNLGINEAMNDGYTDFILFDQDSIPSGNMVSSLYSARQLAIAEKVKVAAVGPIHIDRVTGEEAIFVKCGKYLVNKFKVDKEKPYNNCDFLIASGCLISKDVLEEVGFMESSLFIDCVDLEWCYRAMNFGFLPIVSSTAIMYHQIGDKPLKLFGRNLTIHSPLRHYYFYRNFYHLLKRSYIPLSWKIHVFIKSSIQAMIFCSFLPNRFNHMKAIGSGVLDAIRNKYGRHE